MSSSCRLVAVRSAARRSVVVALVAFVVVVVVAAVQSCPSRRYDRRAP